MKIVVTSNDTEMRCRVSCRGVVGVRSPKVAEAIPYLNLDDALQLH